MKSNMKLTEETIITALKMVINGDVEGAKKFAGVGRMVLRDWTKKAGIAYPKRVKKINWDKIKKELK